MTVKGGDDETVNCLMWVFGLAFAAFMLYRVFVPEAKPPAWSAMDQGMLELSERAERRGR